MLVIPEVTPAEMPEYSKGFNMENALWASDPGNSHKISTSNILQTYKMSPGSTSPGYFNGLAGVKTAMSSPTAGSFRYKVDGLADPKATELWWMVERQKPEMVKTLVAVAKQKGPLGTDAVKILDVVKASFQTREADLVAAPATMQTYEGLESLLAEGQGLELKKATERYKELSKDKEMKDELTARTIYRQCQELLASQKANAPAAGKANLETLQKKYPSTVYGKLAGGAN